MDQRSQWLKGLGIAAVCYAAYTKMQNKVGVAIAPEKVRGPPDAIEAICKQELTATIAADLGVDVQALPAGSTARVCIAPPHGRVIVVDGFLRDDEVSHMRDLVRLTAFASRETGYRFAEATGQHYPAGFLSNDRSGVRTEKHRGDRVLNAVEARMAKFTGVPLSFFENILQMSYAFPVADKKKSKHPALHHDKNSGAPRFVTILTYLTEIPPGGGGHTIFPALPTVAALPAHQEWNKTFHEIFHKAFAGKKQGDKWPFVGVDAGSPKAKDVEVACDAVNRDSLAYFAVRPLPGRAVLFWHEDGHGKALPEQFHAGCPVLRGEKIALQKFKNYEPDHPKCSWYCKL